ncbi:XRE family transcriptional regulator [Jeotgalibacillus sp. S-D1]|uniref:helix-turn-helix domain-containing protein n=1 Tax=Jeotgalibacillus sp. S-D1 TaxID=2552189 RepID=UPI00105A9888|nr:helix-turn-helix transcriptional regulator [Jeotgalibacillus sp. S-D1]TDL31818.1 XRE family transcriptional regulator [Jeotgalibacillus sp. S-D1]
MIGENIIKLRKEKGLTLSELAEKAGVSKSYLSNIERNLKQNPSIQVMEKIAWVLRVDLNQLLEESAVFKTDDKELAYFIKELIDHDISKEQLRELKLIFEFTKWKKERDKGLGY